MYRLSIIALVGALSILHQGQALPPPTSSQVCPAIEYDTSVNLHNGVHKVLFQPHNPNLEFKFVDVHTVLEDITGRPVSVQQNYPMTFTGNGFEVMLVAQEQIEALMNKKPNIKFKYSFTYCVGLNGDTDCDTAHFEVFQQPFMTGEFCIAPEKFWNIGGAGGDGFGGKGGVCGGQGGAGYGGPGAPGLYSEYCKPGQLPGKGGSGFGGPGGDICGWWSPEEPVCDMNCGLPEMNIPRPQLCVRADGAQMPNVMCEGLPRIPDKYCLATQPCCIMPEKFWNIGGAGGDGFGGRGGVCGGRGGDGYGGPGAPGYGAEFCKAGQLPGQGGSGYGGPGGDICGWWSPKEPICDDTQCDTPETWLEVVPQLCLRTDGAQLPDYMCEGLEPIPPKYCPATEPCCIMPEKFWDIGGAGGDGFGGKGGVCGGQGGAGYGGPGAPGSAPEYCKAGQLPGQGGSGYGGPGGDICGWWSPEEPVCDTQCDLPEQWLEREPVLCVRADGAQMPHYMCEGLEEPLAKYCPATEPCYVPQEREWVPEEREWEEPPRREWVEPPRREWVEPPRREWVEEPPMYYEQPPMYYEQPRVHYDVQYQQIYQPPPQVQYHVVGYQQTVIPTGHKHHKKHHKHGHGHGPPPLPFHTGAFLG